MEPNLIEGIPVLDNVLAAYDFDPLDPKGKVNANVFEATRKKDGMKFALKLSDFTNKSKNEIALLESIKHKNIVEIYDKFILLLATKSLKKVTKSEFLSRDYFVASDKS